MGVRRAWYGVRGGVRWVPWRGMAGTGCGGYSGGARWVGGVVRWVRWRRTVGTMEGYDGYGGKVQQWVQWRGMGTVDGHSGGCTGVRGEGGSRIQVRRGEVYVTSSS